MLLKNLAQNTIFQLIARSFTTLANFITILLIGSSLGSFGLGQYNKAFAFIGIFSLFVDFGINAIFLKTKDIAQNVGLLILLRLLIALTIFVLLQPLLFFLPYDPISQIGFSPDDKTFIRILSLILFTYSFSHSINAIFQAKQRFGLLVIPNIILGCNLIFFAVFAYIFKSLELFIWATVIGQIAYVITASILLRKIFDINLLDKKVLFNIKNTFQEKNKFITKLFKSSLPIAATLFLNVLYVRADTLILSFVRSTNEVGVYTLAYKFFDFPLSLSFFIMNAMYPIFLKSHETNKNRFYKMVSKFTLNTFLLSVLLTAIAFFAAPLLKYIQQDFELSILPFKILVFSYPIFFLSNIFLWVIITENKEKWLPIVYLLSLFINVVLNIIYVPKFGYTASALITVLSELIVLVLLFGIMKTRKKKVAVKVKKVKKKKTS